MPNIDAQADVVKLAFTPASNKTNGKVVKRTW
jgi:hypothetical protein